MAYALFCNDAKLSKAYPTEADVWKLARQSGLVVDAVSEHGEPVPQPILDNDYEIRVCLPDPHEDPVQNAPMPNARLSTSCSSRRDSKTGLMRWSGRLRGDGNSQGVAIASEARVDSATHALLRCNPLIAPVTLSTLPTGQVASCTKATSYGASTRGSDLRTV